MRSVITADMENQLVEQVVKKEKNVKYYLNVILIIAGAVGIPGVIIALAFIINLPYLIYLALFVFLFCIYGVWFFISSLKVEYEYAFLPSTLRIDKVVAKRRRKSIVKIDVKQLDNFFPYSDREMGQQKYAKVYSAARTEFSTENYVASFHSEAKGRCALIFSPNEQMIDAMKPFFNSNLRKKLFQENRL